MSDDPVGDSASRSTGTGSTSVGGSAVEPLRRVLIWTLATLTASAVLQIALYRHGGAEALSDIPGRLSVWNLSPHHLPYIDAHIEYPVVVGYVAFLLSVLTPSHGWTFLANCTFNVVLAMTMTVLLRVHGQKQIWRWVLGTPLLFFAFHNWDLWAMVPAVIGILAYRRHNDRIAGTALAIGASTKLFPGLFLAPLIVMRWCSGDRRGATRLLGWGCITTIVLNGPIALVSPSGWLYPVRFQGRRDASWGTLWYWLESVPGVRSITASGPAALANKVSIVALGLGLLFVTVLAVRRKLGVVAVCASVTAVFLLSNKIYSPTYDLWMVPFFVLLPLPRRIWVAYCAADFGIFVIVFGRFHGLWDDQVVLDVLWIFVLVRAATLLSVVSRSLQPGRDENHVQRRATPSTPSAPDGSPDSGSVWDDVAASTGGSS
ncbi:MAG: hypothetical protein WBF71_02440 [Microthrixaceae bacterium]